MKSFGYTINKDRQIDYDKADTRISDYVRVHEPSINLCIACGTCTATCSSGNFTDLSLREILLLVRRGETGEIKTKISKCMLCGKCFLACPRGVNTRNVILKINQAIEKFSK